MPEAKKSLRQSVLAKLAALGETERLDRSRRVVARLLECAEFQRAATLMAFYSFGTELNTHELLAECLRLGKTLALPRTRQREVSLSVHRVTDLEAGLERNRLGFCEPKLHLPVVPLPQIDLLIVPGLAFDPSGNRLGRGRGYYDRFLASRGLRAVRCALLFDCQCIEAVPVAAHDRPVDLMVTETRVIRVGGAVRG